MIRLFPYLQISRTNIQSNLNAKIVHRREILCSFAHLCFVYSREILQKTKMSVNYEWYQTDQKVVVTVKIKQAAEKNCVVNIDSDSVAVNGDEGINLKLELYQKINEAESGYKTTPMKIEISLKKLIGDRWPTLIKTNELPKAPAPPMASLSDSTPTPATVSEPIKAPRDHKDWDKVVNEVYTKEDEKV